MGGCLCWFCAGRRRLGAARRVAVYSRAVPERGFWGEYLVFRSCPGEAGALLRAPSTGSAPSQASPRLWRVLQVSEVGYKVRLGAFVGKRNVYLTSSKATNKYKKLIGKVLTGS